MCSRYLPFKSRQKKTQFKGFLIFFVCRIRAKNFPRGWSFVQGVRCVPLLVGAPLTGYINIRSGNTRAGYYLSFVFVILGNILAESRDTH